jgi:hypothetical protein
LIIWGVQGGFSPLPRRFFEEGEPFMARYEHFPIYKRAMDLTIFFEKIVRNFSRNDKYTLIKQVRENSREIVSLITKTNSRVMRIF